VGWQTVYKISQLQILIEKYPERSIVDLLQLNGLKGAYQSLEH